MSRVSGKRKRASSVRDDSPYRTFVQGLPCVCASMGGCSGDIIAAHATLGPNEKGTSLKVDDRQVIPMCCQHHDEFDGRAQPRFTDRWSKEQRYDFGFHWVRSTQEQYATAVACRAVAVSTLETAERA